MGHKTPKHSRVPFAKQKSNLTGEWNGELIFQTPTASCTDKHLCSIPDIHIDKMIHHFDGFYLYAIILPTWRVPFADQSKDLLVICDPRIIDEECRTRWAGKTVQMIDDWQLLLDHNDIVVLEYQEQARAGEWLGVRGFYKGPSIYYYELQEAIAQERAERRAAKRAAKKAAQEAAKAAEATQAGKG